MAGNLLLNSTALILLDNLLSQPTQSVIGGITVDTTIEEYYEDVLEVTEHPVASGTNISDHSFKRPMGLRMRCQWSDSNLNALLGQLNSLFTGGALAASDYIAGIYSQLLNLQESRQTFSVVSGLRLYDSMLMTGLFVHRDQRTRFALRVEAVMQQVIIADTQTATLPPQASMKTPAANAEVVNSGQQSLQSGSPSPGGSLPVGGPP
jgi:hypothetical protein